MYISYYTDRLTGKQIYIDGNDWAIDDSEMLYSVLYMQNLGMK